MPPRRREKKAAKRALAEQPCPDGADLISALPDGVLQHALGFLPAHDAVRTCVLGSRWRHLWQSMHRLRVTVKPLWSADKQHMFGNRLLLLRDPRSTVDHCELDLRGSKEANTLYADLWIRHALLLRSRVVHLRYVAMIPSCPPLASTYLEVLRLERVDFEDHAIVDLSSCRVLEDLQFSLCKIIGVHEIRCPSSAKRLSIVNSCFDAANGPRDDHTRISAPSLTWLRIDDCDGLPPVLQSMPSLQTASVMLGCFFDGDRSCTAGPCGHGHCLGCNEELVRRKEGGCVLLGGLSNATNLKYRGSFGMATFKSDLRFCPQFRNLKTFDIENFCVTSDLHALLRFLQLTPNLEKLTVELCEKEACSQLEVEDYSPVSPPIPQRQPRKVYIKCLKVDERAQKALKIFFTEAGFGYLEKLNM